MDTIRVLLADDHALMPAGVRALLEQSGSVRVLGEAADGDEAVRMAADLRPDVVVMDLTMPGLGGLQATAAISAQGGSSPHVLVLTMHGPEEFLIPVLRAGGSGYMTKDSADEEFLAAIRTVAGGEVFLHPSAARLLLDNFRTPANGENPGDALELLSSREHEVLAGTAQGFTASEIAASLRISPKTVDTYRQRAMEKLGLRRRSEIVRFALEHGLLYP